jgi:phosphatidylserine/phosphatidylglycerophosphate/cardiolipin synthase-like enzyme
MSKKHIISTLAGIFIITSLITGCSAKNVNAETKNNTVQIQSTESKDNSQIETYFTKKEGNLDQILIKEINTAQKNLNVAIYSLTKENIANAILEAKKRGLDIEVITDKQESQSKAQKAILDKFKANGIPVKINSHSGLMHLKLTIIDNKTVCGGSYNYTQNATEKNDENLIVIRNSNIINEYLTEYNSMWSNTSDYKNY